MANWNMNADQWRTWLTANVGPAYKAWRDHQAGCGVCKSVGALHPTVPAAMLETLCDTGRRLDRTLADEVVDKMTLWEACQPPRRDDQS